MKKDDPRVEGVEQFRMSDKVILTRSFESIAAMTGQDAGDELHPTLAMKITGRLNNTQETTDVTFLMHPRDAVGLVEAVVHSLSAFTEEEIGIPASEMFGGDDAE